MSEIGNALDAPRAKKPLNAENILETPRDEKILNAENVYKGQNVPSLDQKKKIVQLTAEEKRIVLKKHDEFFPNDIWLEGENISVKIISFPKSDYYFIKRANGIETQSKGVYKKVVECTSVYDEFMPQDENCLIDYNTHFFDEDKIDCPIV